MLTRLRRNREAGFTLLELAVAMALAGTLFGLAGVVVGRGLVLTDKVTTHVSVTTDVQYALDAMSRQVRVADPVVKGTPTEIAVTVRRGGACSVVEYAVETSGSPVNKDYRATGQRLVTRSRACTASAFGPANVALAAVPSGSSPFTYFQFGSTTPLPTPLSAANLAKVALVRVSLAAAPSGTTTSSAVSTDIQVRNAQ